MIRHFITFFLNFGRTEIVGAVHDILKLCDLTILAIFRSDTQFRFPLTYKKRSAILSFTPNLIYTHWLYQGNEWN